MRTEISSSFERRVARPTLCIVWGVVILTGCAASLKSQYADVERIVQERTGQRIEWNVNAPTSADTEISIGPLLSQPLAVSSAVRIALINNRSLQATLMEIGISRADLIQAGLLANPSVFMRYRWQTVGGDASNFEFRLAQDFIDLVTLPLRRRVAQQQLEQAKAQVAHAALDLACQVQVAFYALQGQVQARDRQRRFVETMGSAFEFARRRRLAGEISDHALLAQKIALGRARQNLAGMDLQIVTDRERLNRLMGLAGPPASAWSIAGELPQPPAQEPPRENLEAQAVECRMDLAASRRETATIQETLKLQQITRWVPFFHVGVDYERNTNQTKVIGPTVVFDLPIFDWGQAKVTRSKALLEQSRQRTAALETDIRSEIRAAHERLLTARNTIRFHHDELLPQVRQLVLLDQEKPSGGTPAPGDLLKDRQDEVKAQQDDIDALRDYWIARARLEQVAGGR